MQKMSYDSIATVAVLTIVVAVDVGLRKALGQSLSANLGGSLAGVGLGIVLPYVVFENLLAGKIYRIRNLYSIAQSNIRATYTVEPVDVSKILRARILTLICVLACAVLWIAAQVSQSSESVFGHNASMAYGSVSLLIGWLYLQFV